jgi:serine/threonine protein kinase
MTSSIAHKTLPSPRSTGSLCAHSSKEMPRAASCAALDWTALASSKFVGQKPIARGGMSMVIRAFDVDLQREVALKVLLPGCETDGIANARLSEEARITTCLEHPHIPPVYEFGADDRGVRFFSMKLVNGETLESIFNRAGSARLSREFIATFLEIFKQVCAAVSFAHRRGILHRDLKPSNVMVDFLDEVFVIDWGIAKKIQKAEEPTASVRADDPAYFAREPVGTPSYMAPEQLWMMDDRLSERTDVFGLGAVLYHALTGAPPGGFYEARTPRLRACQVPRAINGAVPAELLRIALKAMSPRPADRYPQVDHLTHEIDRFLRTPSAWPLNASAASRRRARLTGREFRSETSKTASSTMSYGRLA